MRRSGAEKMEIIRLVEQSDLSVRSTLRQLGIAPSTFYGWYQRYLEGGPEGLEDRRPRPRARWNRISREVRQQVVDLADGAFDDDPRPDGAELHAGLQVGAGRVDPRDVVFQPREPVVVVLDRFERLHAPAARKLAEVELEGRDLADGHQQKVGQVVHRRGNRGELRGVRRERSAEIRLSTFQHRRRAGGRRLWRHGTGIATTLHPAQAGRGDPRRHRPPPSRTRLYEAHPFQEHWNRD